MQSVESSNSYYVLRPIHVGSFCKENGQCQESGGGFNMHILLKRLTKVKHGCNA